METPEKDEKNKRDEKSENIENNENNINAGSIRKKNWLVLVPAALLALSVCLFFLTADVRKKQENQKENSSYQTVLPEGNSFTPVKTDKKTVENLLEEAGYGDICLKQMLEAENKEKQVVGTIYELGGKSGYGGSLTLLIGMNESEAICGIMVKDASKIVEALTKDEMDSFLEQFLYGRRDKVFWTETPVFGGVEAAKMDGAPAVSREIVRMVNSCRVLEEQKDMLAGGAENE